jgi:hypothetical protein
MTEREETVVKKKLSYSLNPFHSPASEYFYVNPPLTREA